MYTDIGGRLGGSEKLLVYEALTSLKLLVHEVLIDIYTDIGGRLGSSEKLLRSGKRCDERTARAC